MRDRDYERQFLEHVAHAAKQSGGVERQFADAVLRRLEKGGEEYGDSWVDRDWDELVANAAEEGEDVPAWLVLALQKMPAEIPDEHAHQIRCLLMEAAADGMRLWVRLSIARNIARESAGSKAEEPLPISGQ